MIIQKYVKVGERGQIAIPKEMRENEKIEPMQIVKLVDIAGEIKIVPVKRDKEPEERILEILQSVDLGDNAWEEIQKDRER